MLAAICIPDFALQAALRHTPELRAQPVAVLGEKTAKAPIVQCTAAARAAGVMPGMSASQGRARCPELRLKLRSPGAEESARAALLEAAFRIAPLVENTAEGVCTCELKGARAFDPGVLAEGVRSSLAALQLDARVGFAPTADLALLAAQSAGTWRSIEDAQELAELPITRLDPSPALLDILQKWGVCTLGAFVILGKSALAARLGPEALPLYARATGAVARPLRCLPPAETFEESIDFEAEIESLEPLLFMLRRFLEQLALRLEAVYLVAAEIRLGLGLANGEETARIFKIPSPTNDVEVLFRMLHTHLESFTAEHPIARLQLVITPSRPARQQFGLFESALRDPNQFYETLARLGALVGHDRVGVPVLEASHRPDAFRLVPADFTAAPRSASAAALPLGLALQRFRPALSAQVEMGERPLHLRSAKVSGAITAAHGPMPLSGDWWSGDRWSRSEWDVQLRTGTLCRIYEQDSAWFVEGVYD